MSTSLTVSVTVAPEAAARVAELGMQVELEQMVQRVREVVPHLESIDVARLQRHVDALEMGDDFPNSLDHLLQLDLHSQFSNSSCRLGRDRHRYRQARAHDCPPRLSRPVQDTPQPGK